MHACRFRRQKEELIAAKPWEHAAEARVALQAIMADPGLGPLALLNGSLIANALEDLLPDAPRERAVLVLAAKARLAQSLQGHVDLGIDVVTAISLTATSFEDVSPLDPDACRWAVTELAMALGLLPAPTSPAAGGVPAPTQADPAAALAGQDTRTAAASPSPVVPGPGSPAARTAVVASSNPQSRPSNRKRRDPGINGVALSTDGRLLATAGADGMVRLWDLIAGTQAMCLARHAGPVRSVAFSPDGRLLATAGGTDAARLWDVTSGDLVRIVTPGLARDIVFSADGRLLVTAGGGTTHAASMAAGTVDRAAWLWEVADGRSAGRVPGPIRHTTSVAISPDGRLLATAGAGDDVRLWDAATGMLAGALHRRVASAESVAFSPDGRLLATAGDGKPAKLWDVAARTLVRTATPWPARAVAFSPDGRLLATAGGGRASAAGVAAAALPDSAAWVWDVASGSMISCLADHDDQIEAVTFSADSRLVATSARDRTALVWDLRTPKAPRGRFSGD